MTEITAEGEIIDVEPTTEIEVRPQQQGLFRTEDPAEFLTKASTTANALAAVVRKQKLYVVISGKDYVRYEGWSMLGSLLGVTAHTVWTRKLEDGWEARVEAHTLSGHIVGAAEAECLRSETLWAKRDDYALRSMAQTRAAAKALRQPLGFVMSLAGFEATPFEEMPPDDAPAAEQPKPKGGLKPHQRRLYAKFKETDGVTQDGLKELLKQAGAEDLAHATEEQCEQVAGWLEVDIPFEPTPAGVEPGPYATDQAIDDFLQLARTRGKANLDQAEKAIAAQRRLHDGQVDAQRLAGFREALLAAAPEPATEELQL